MTELVLAARGICHGFGGRILFSRLDLEVPATGTTALIGPSGTGKTTLLSILAGDTRPDRGSVEVREDGQSRPLGAGDVVRIPQGGNCLPARTALENVRIGALAAGRPDAEDAAIFALGVVGLGDRADALARTLSGGELQRIAVARAVCAGSSFLLADEPTASLDRANVELIGGVLANVAETVGVIVCTHDPLLAQQCTRLVDLASIAHTAHTGASGG